jgi:hypothetical protein
MTSHGAHVYLSAADRQLETYLDSDAFDRSLLLNILFQPGVLIPDIFFFISAGVVKHLQQERLTLLEAALQQGHVVPSFSDPPTTSFRRALENKKRDGILGLRQDAHETALRLDAALDRAPGFKPAYWPESNVGEGYQRLAVQLLAADEAPRLPPSSGISQERLVELWDATKEWRTDCLDEAIAETARLAGGGLRRGCLMTAVGRKLGVVGDRGRIDDIAQLLRPEVSPIHQYALHYFCRWMTDIYHYNQSLALGATPNFPGYDVLEGAMATELLRQTQCQGNPAADGNSIRLEVPMPHPAWLSRLSAADLLAIRDDVGAGYMACVKAWHESPADTGDTTVGSRLIEYSTALVDRVRRAKGDPGGFLEATLGRFGRVDPDLVVILGTTATLAVSQMSTDAALLVAASSSAYATYKWCRRQPAIVSVTLGVPEPRSRDQRCSDVNILRSSDYRAQDDETM